MTWDQAILLHFTVGVLWTTGVVVYGARKGWDIDTCLNWGLIPGLGWPLALGVGLAIGGVALILSPFKGLYCLTRYLVGENKS